MATVLGLLTTLLTVGAAPATDLRSEFTLYCREAKITGYVRTDFSGRTWDGTPIWTDEPIVAASWDIPINAVVMIAGLGSFRVADRGRLGSDGWIDVATWTRAEAYALTGRRQICVAHP